MHPFSALRSSRLGFGRRAALPVFASALLCLAAVPPGQAATIVPAQIVVKLSSSAPAVGQDITVTATAKDTSGHTYTSWSAPASWSDRSGALSPAAPADFVNGVSTTVAHVDVPFRNDVIAITSGSTGKSRAFNVVGPLDHLSVSVPGSHTVNMPFTVRATARDAANNLVTSFAGSASWSDSAGALASFTPSDFVAGVSRTSVQTSIPLRGDHVAISSDGLSASSIFNVIGPATHLSLSIPSSIPVASPFKITARALDAAGNVATGYNAPAGWSETSGTIVPAAPSDFVAGVSTTTAQVPVAFKSDGLTLTSGGLSATGAFNVLGPFDHIALTWTPSSTPPIDCSSAAGSLVAQAQDVAGNVLTSYNDAAPSWFIGGAEATDTISPAVPAPFVAGVSNNPTVTLSVARRSALDIGVISSGKVEYVRVCG
jgi:hypothetical protein